MPDISTNSKPPSLSGGDLTAAGTPAVRGGDDPRVPPFAHRPRSVRGRIDFFAVVLVVGCVGASVAVIVASLGRIFGVW